MKDPLKDLSFFLVALAVVVALLLASLFAPCWLFAKSPVDVTPAWCLTRFVRGGC